MPLSYDTVVDAACKWPIRAVGTNPCTSENPIMIGDAKVVIMRALHDDVANTKDAVVFTVGLEVVAIVAASPDGADALTWKMLEPNRRPNASTRALIRRRIFVFVSDFMKLWLIIPFVF
jgi:hypothetical protein